MIHIWSVLCTKAVIDRDSNNITLFEVIEQFTVKLPETPPEGGEGVIPAIFELVTLWARDYDDQPEVGQARVVLVRPNGLIDDKGARPYEADLTAHRRTRQRMKYAGLLVREAGRHVFRVELRHGDAWREVAAVPLVVNINVEQQALPGV
jgi:hypothetical protein